MTGIRCLKIAGVVAVLCAMAATSHAQTFTTIASFNLYLGRSPVAPLIQGPDGNFYGTTQSGGTTLNDPLCSPFGCGTVFKVTPSGTVTTLYNFCSKNNCADGTEPFAGLVLGTNGNFYGTTFSGGANDNRGTVFEITPQGKLTTLHSFCSQTDCPDGAQPLSGLTLGTDGNFYGTTIGGGSTFSGTAYRISPTGNFAVLYSFCSRTACADGAEPAGTLALATNGKFYGTAPLGGETDGGSIFQLTPSGLETVVHNFPGPENPDNIANGVMQGADGNLYGTSYLGGSNRFGYVFKLTPAGQFTRLYSFCSKANCSDGAEPQSELIQGTDGNLYGTTAGLGGNPFRDSFRNHNDWQSDDALRFLPAEFRLHGRRHSRGGTASSYERGFLRSDEYWWQLSGLFGRLRHNIQRFHGPQSLRATVPQFRQGRAGDRHFRKQSDGKYGGQLQRHSGKFYRSLKHAD